MADVKTEIKRIEFIIEEELTHCNLYYTSDEPGNPFWGGGWKTKHFASHWSIIDFINKEVSDFLKWPNGRYVQVRDEELDL